MSHRFVGSSRTLLALLSLYVAVACRSETGSLGPTTEECADACNRVGAADCGDIGSECVNACVQQITPAECAAEVGAYLKCFWSVERYRCQRGLTVPEGCTEESEAAQVCAAAGAGGVGGESGENGEGDENAGGAIGGGGGGPVGAGQSAGGGD
jgi:hypothetical protein